MATRREHTRTGGHAPAWWVLSAVASVALVAFVGALSALGV